MMTSHLLVPGFKPAVTNGDIPIRRFRLLGIARFAKHKQRCQCDMIVMGTRGMGTVANLVLGSVANKVMHLANIPLTLVK